MGGRGKEKNQKPATKNLASPSEGEAEGGCGGGIPPRPSRSEAPPPARTRAEPSRKTFLSFLEEKSVARKSKNAEKIFLRGRPPSSAAGGGAERVDFFKNF